MRRDEMLALLRELAQIEQNEGDIECGGCRRNTDVNFPDELAKCHYADCKLAAAIAWLEDEKNITNGGCCNVDGWLLEDER